MVFRGDSRWNLSVPPLSWRSDVELRSGIVVGTLPTDVSAALNDLDVLWKESSLSETGGEYVRGWDTRKLESSLGNKESFLSGNLPPCRERRLELPANVLEGDVEPGMPLVLSIGEGFKIMDSAVSSRVIGARRSFRGGGSSGLNSMEMCLGDQSNKPLSKGSASGVLGVLSATFV